MINIEIKVPYTTRPVMHRRTGPAFRQIADSNKIAIKELELQRHDKALWGALPLANDFGLVSRMASHCGKLATNSIVELALGFQEDIAILHRGRLVATCFCFPSGWIPIQKLGMTLSDIHKPVADSQDLVRMSDRLAQTMADPTLSGFERTVWTVTANPNLNNMPGAYPDYRAFRMEDLYFRYEYQSTDCLDDGVTSLFFVDTNVVPLLTVWQDLGSRIQDSINSMTDTMLTYKNLHQIKKIINAGK